VKRRFAVAFLAVVAAAGIAACSSGTGGSPFPTTTGAAATGGGSSSSSGGGGGGAAAQLAAIQPCDLLSSSQVSQNGLTSEGSSSGSGARSCKWKNTTADSGFGYVVSANIRDQQGISDINTDGVTVTNDPIGKHQARQAKDSDGGDGCMVSIAVTDSSRVDVQANDGNSDLNQASQLANQFATLIEPQLPGGS
jgi:hypothetical protein